VPATRVVVVGAGLGGLRAAEAIRAHGFGGEVVVVGQEPYRPYNRPPLSKGALAGELTLQALALRQRPSVRDVMWRLGETVTSVDVHARTVRLAGDEVLDYAALVVATGVSARARTAGHGSRGTPCGTNPRRCGRLARGTNSWGRESWCSGRVSSAVRWPPRPLNSAVASPAWPSTTAR
jgi:NADPH-dependent 2,4-dienoyl-CoA reductase/sulfur reductase-like enzyme